MDGTSTLASHQALNRSAWQQKASSYVENAEENWKREQPRWGIWSIPNTSAPLLPDDLSGKRCVELGCGTAYVSRWMERRGGEIYALDPTKNQLKTAHRLKDAHASEVQLVEGFAENLPFADASFDFAISEYGASLWADPYKWIPEAARVLKPGGRLVFLTCHVLAQLCAPDSEEDPHASELLRPYLGLYRLEWTEPDTVEFSLPHGKLIELCLANQLHVDRLLELGAPEEGTSDYSWASPEWAGRWPTEEVWFMTKTS